MVVSEPTVEVTAAVIVAAARVLAARRTSPPDVAGRWELPGGKVDVGETPEQAVTREVAEELGCQVKVLGALEGRVPIKPGYELTAYLVQLVAGEPTPHEHDAIRWVSVRELDEVDWLPSDRPFLGQIADLLAGGKLRDQAFLAE
jgi:8-oxo-dGTP diphosphatase